MYKREVFILNISSKSEVCLSLGSNLGNRIKNLQQALSCIKSFFLIRKISHIIETKALLLPDSAKDWNIPYCNMVVRGETNLSPQELLVQIKKVEENLGRDLKAPRWSPRIIDIDIIYYENIYINNELLNIPHKEIKNRDFLQYLLREIGYKEFYENNYSALNHFVITPKLVGILNITPDSFSDGGKFFSVKNAELQARKLYKDGATLIDIGAQSTRPGYKEVPPKVEIKRLSETLERCKDISESICIDTYSDEVAEYVIKKHNIKWINDQNSSFTSKTIKMFAENDIKLIIMLKGTNISWFKSRINELTNLGIKSENIIVDPGIGFGKSAMQSLNFIKNIRRIKNLGHEIFIGHSRKSFISQLSIAPAPERDIETIAISDFLAKAGVDYLRVHNVEKHMRFFVAQHCIKNV